MIRKYIHIVFTAAIGLALLFGLTACEIDSPETAAHAETETGHEGHNHGPGGHGAAAATGTSVGSEVHSASEELDWCREHSVPESECTTCNPELIASFKETGDWCAGHDLPESHCRLCNPGIVFEQEKILQQQRTGSVAAADNADLDWCLVHSVPESECTTCDPSRIQAFVDANDWCVGHDLPESHCRLCNPEIVFEQEEILRERRLNQAGNDIEIALNFRPNAKLCATDGALIQFASATTAERAGLTLHRTRMAEFEESLEAPAEVVFDETDATVVTSTVPSLVARWLVSPGDVVTRGDVMAIVQSPEIAELKSQLVSANAANVVQQKELARQQKLKDGNLISTEEFERQTALAEQARAEYVAARGLLMSAGLQQADIDEILEHGSLSNQFALRAPADGLVVERIAKLGELLEAGRAFAMIANPESMWIEARLTEEQIRRVDIGHELVYTSDGRGLHRVGGEVIWISRVLDPHTKTATVRAKVINPDHHLRAGEFGRVTLIRKATTAATLVPKDAVQWEGCCNVVFVKEADDRFRPRKVDVRDGEGPYYQVTGGLEPGEEIVVDGAFLLKTELKKTSIGAGCCGLEPVG